MDSDFLRRPFASIPGRHGFSAVRQTCVLKFLTGSVSILSITGTNAQKYSEPAYFTSPDSICVDVPFTVSNVSAGSTFYWSFCSANSTNWPVGNNLGNVGNTFGKPKFITLVEDQGNYYCFVTNSGNRSLVRLNFGGSLMTPPASSTPVNPSAFLSETMRGIQIKKDYLSGKWVGFMADGNSVTRLVFNNGLTWAPNTTTISCPGLGAGSGLTIIRENNNWIGFLADSLNNKVFRMQFDSSLMKIPVFTDMGDFQQLAGPMGLEALYFNGQNYLFICNSSSSTVSVLLFGSSFINNPTWTSGGYSAGFNTPIGITVIADCNYINGIVTNQTDSSQALVHITFNQTISGGPIGPPSNGDPDMPYGISEMIRVGDTIYTVYVNNGNSTVSHLYYTPCTSSTPVSSTSRQPGPVVYHAPGDYNILLRVDEGLPGGSTYCRPVKVIPAPVIDLGKQKYICQGSHDTLDAGSGFVNYLWSTGDSLRKIVVHDSGTYWVHALTSYGCLSSDTVRVLLTATINITLDTTICYGEKYFAGGAWQTAGGQFTDTLTSSAGCDSVIHTNLSVRPKINVNIGADTVLCPGDTKILDATLPGASGYVWQDSSTSARYTATEPGVYWVHVTLNQCMGGDTINIEVCPYVLSFPTAFSPDNDGLNDVFRPVSVNVTDFHMEIFDRWGTLLFSTDDILQGWNGIYKNRICDPGTYVYDVTFETLSEPGQKKKAKGSFAIVQ